MTRYQALTGGAQIPGRLFEGSYWPFYAVVFGDFQHTRPQVGCLDTMRG